MKKILFFALALSSAASYAQTNTYPWPENSKVGIGTNAPEQKLTVVMDGAENGSGVAVKAVNNGGPGSQPGVAFLNSSGQKRVYSYLDVGSDSYNVGNFTGDNIMTINQAGNVGFGTTVPGSWFPGKVLELAGSRPILRLSPTTEGGLATILFKGAYNNAPGSADEFHLNYASSVAQPRLTIGSYKMGGGSTVLSLLGTGNVGIGMEFPTDKLSVNGNIGAKEIKVENKTWPDYVFKPSYHLVSLDEVEQYIDENHHLPGLPSALKVEKEGVNLGEMNVKLLEKIEELTLYLIEMKKSNDLLTERVRQLERK